jgi:hypothetical protein
MKLKFKYFKIKLMEEREDLGERLNIKKAKI